MKADEPRCTARTPAQETYFEQFERDMRAAAALGLTKERRSRKPVPVVIPRHRELVSICSALEKHDVDYLVVGGAAVILHGYYRQTSDRHGRPLDRLDIDLWYRADPHSFFDMLRAFEEIGLDTSYYRKQTLIDPARWFVRFEEEAFSLDVLPKIPGLGTFRESYARKHWARLHDTDIAVLSYDELILAKQTAGRPKDLIDIAELVKIRGRLSLYGPTAPAPGYCGTTPGRRGPVARSSRRSTPRSGACP